MYDNVNKSAHYGSTCFPKDNNLEGALHTGFLLSANLDLGEGQTTLTFTSFYGANI